MKLLDRLGEAQARALTLALYLGAPLCYGIVAILVRQDYNWDLLNYHHYNPFAWLNGRRGHDIDAAILPGGYFNPLLHLPLYLATQALPPKLTAFLVGALQGVNAILVFQIARAALPGPDAPQRTVAALGIGVLGTVAAGNLGQIGASFGDNILSLFVLGALAILVRDVATLGCRRAALAGIALGLAVGLKPTMGLYAPGLALACLVATGTRAHRLALAASLAAGSALGWALSGGFWALDLWRSFGNPLFPFFNDVFKSPFAAIDPHKNLVYLPKTWWDAFTLPWRFPFNPRLVGEVRFLDLRVPILYSLAFAAAAAWAFRRPALRPEARMTLALLGASFVAWLGMFAIYRYLIALELLAPLGILLLVLSLVATRRLSARSLAPAVLILALVLLPTLRVAGWGHVPWHDTYFGVEPPPMQKPERTMILLPGTEPTAFLVPYFPRAVRFVRVSRWILDSPEPPTGLERLAYDAVARHDGPFYAIFRQSERAIAEKALALRRLAIAREGCSELVVRAERTKRDKLEICAVERRR